MEIKRSGSQPSSKGPAEWFIGDVVIDPLFQAPAQHALLARALALSRVPTLPGILIHSARR